MTKMIQYNTKLTVKMSQDIYCQQQDATFAKEDTTFLTLPGNLSEKKHKSGTSLSVPASGEATLQFFSTCSCHQVATKPCVFRVKGHLKQSQNKICINILMAVGTHKRK